MAWILVVDDDPDVAEAVAMVLAGEEYRVACAATRDAALALARQHRPVLALVDLYLPGTDVERLIDELRAAAPMSIAICTGADAATAAAAAAGADGLLPKPFSVDDLLEVVHRLAGQPTAFTP